MHTFTFTEFVRAYLWSCIMHCPDAVWGALDPALRASCIMLLQPARY